MLVIFLNSYLYFWNNRVEWIKRSLLLFICLLTFIMVNGQINNQNSRQYEIRKITQPIKVDGLVDSIWASANKTSAFNNHRPSDIGLAQSQTEVKMLYNEQFIYLLVKAYHGGDKQIIQTLKRDNFFDNDGFGLVLDPINTQTNGFFFGTSSRGAQSECLVTTSGSTDWNWDAKWYSKVLHYEDYWLVEMAIPFYTIRYSPENKVWGINFMRNDLINNSYSTWTIYPGNFSDFDLGYIGTMQWSSEIPQARKRITLIPSLSTNTGKDFQEGTNTETKLIPSLDVKYALNSSLNLDLTINPDFSQIEVDQQVTNLSRFSLFFPERRTFFQENSDLFNDFGRSDIQPFFSRRIGLTEGNNIPIRFGARLTGNMTDNLRVGLMNVQTAEKEDLDSQNYGLLALQHRVLKRSFISGFLVNRQNTSTKGEYNRVAGSEFNYSSENGFISGKAMYYKSLSDGINSNNNFMSSSLFLSKRGYRLFIRADHIDDNYLADVGFTPRLFNYDAVNDTTIRVNYQKYNIFAARNFRPENGPIVFHGPRIQNILYTNHGNKFNERSSYIGYEIDFANQSELDIGLTNYRVRLLFPISFFNDSAPLPATTYQYTDFFFDWDSDPRKLFSYGTVFTAGSFYSGQRIGFRSYLQHRIQPWLRLRLDHNYNHLDFNEIGTEDLQLIGLRAEVSFSNNMFWTTFLQYNTQASNFNINSRFQWRFAPMSDLFVVYTDNYFSDTFLVKNRYLSVKINYWLNL